MTSPYRVPIEQLEQERVARTDQVVLTGDGTGPPPVAWSGPAGDGDGHGDGDPDSPGAGENGADGEDVAGFEADDDRPCAGDLPPPGAIVANGQQPAA